MLGSYGLMPKLSGAVVFDPVPIDALTRLENMCRKYGASLYVAKGPNVGNVNSDGSGASLSGTDAQNVGLWLDQTGSRNALQASSPAKPLRQLVDAGGGNLQPALVFDGVDDFLQTASIGGAPYETLIAVVSVENANTGTRQRFLGKTQPSLGLAGEVVSGNLSPYFEAAKNAGACPVVPFVFSVFAGGGQRAARLNSSVVFSEALSYSSATAPLTIGAASGGAVPFRGSIFGAVYAPVAIPDADLLRIEQLLNLHCFGKPL